MPSLPPKKARRLLWNWASPSSKGQLQNEKHNKKMHKSTRRIVDLDGLRISYRAQGQGRPPLLLHGGWMTRNLTWGRQVHALSKQFLVLSPDMRGHGYTNNPGGIFSSYRRLAWDMIEFVDALDLKQRPLVMGHSAGAVISLYMSIYQPDIMARQVLSGISPFLGTSEKFKQGSRNYFGTDDPAIPPGKWYFTLRHPRLCAKLTRAHHEMHWYDLLHALWPLRCSALKLDPGDYKKVKCPTLVVNGAEDEFSTVEEARSMTKLIAKSCFTAIP
jgi:pimeloyl-ACP methyl ester carboxylesterase